MTSRDRAHQNPPRGALQATFPAHRPGRSTWHRAHRDHPENPDRGCWFFSSLSAERGPGGRFDLLSPDGTCYFADSDLAAARERLGRPGDLIAADEVDGVVVSTAVFDPGVLADTLARDAARHGITMELSATMPYEITQQWATAFAVTGFDGIHYQPRFSTEPAVSIAVFGKAGPSPDSASVNAIRPLADVFVTHGYTVITTPPVTELGDLLD